jgi:acetyl-CoA C-acetyltransferase
MSAATDEYRKYRHLYGKPFDTITGAAGNRCDDVAGNGGGLPVILIGSLNAKRHPQGATVVAQCVELVGQLRGEVTQVDGARVALAHNVGGPTAVSAFTILEGPGGHGR